MKRNNSRHITRDGTKFESLTQVDGDTVAFSGREKGKIVVIAKYWVRKSDH